MKVPRKLITISTSGNNGLIAVAPLSLLLRASWIIPQSKSKITKIRKAVKIPTMSPITVFIIICRPVGRGGASSKSCDSMKEE
jgi:hypothetical protein